MNISGIYCGATSINKNNSMETKIKNNIKLEYYSIEEQIDTETKTTTLYGVSVIKKEYSKHNVKCERSSVKKISTNKKIVMNIIKVLKNCKVTPTTLEYVLEDLLKQKCYKTA